MADAESSLELCEASESFEETGVSWKGTPLSCLRSLNRTLPTLEASKSHTVMFKIPSKNPESSPTEYEDIWDGGYVNMPCSPKNLYTCGSSQDKKTVPRWTLITKALSGPIKNSRELEKAIFSFNNLYRHKWNFNGLHDFCSSVLTEKESNDLFKSTIPGMAKLALDLPKLFTKPLPLLSQRKNHSVSMSQKQIASLLANAFFCTFPGRSFNTKKGNYPDINFISLFFADKNRTLPSRKVEKLKCLFHYFNRILKTDGDGVVTFTRQYIAPKDVPKWSKLKLLLPKLHICSKGLIETTGRNFLQVDFANRQVGGGVLKEGCVQEEIRFVICPELLVSRLFTESLDGTESLIIMGCEQYSEYSGYGSSFKWTGDHQDETPKDSWNRISTQIVAIDATRFRFLKKDLQYTQEYIDRELNKAYAGFVGSDDELAAVATGNWGCGAYQGNPHLKSILQLMAAAVAGRDVAYFTFGCSKLRDSIYQLYTVITEKNVTIGELYQLICQYSVKKRKGQDIGDFIKATLRAKT